MVLINSKMRELFQEIFLCLRDEVMTQSFPILSKTYHLSHFVFLIFELTPAEFIKIVGPSLLNLTRLIAFFQRLPPIYLDFLP